MTSLLDVRGLSVAFGDVEVVHDVSFSLRAGEALGIVGESGSGKTQTMLAVLRLLARGGRATAGSVTLSGRELLTLSAEEMRQVRGRDIALVSQDALSALNPAMTVGTQMAEPLIFNEGMSEDAALARCAELLDQVGIPGARARLDAYPHQLSGGMQQRVGLARALAVEPKVLLMDEPFAALDAMTREVLRRELLQLWSLRKTAIVFVTHDLDEAILLSQRIILLRPRPGRIDQIVDVPLPQPRWQTNPRKLPEFAALQEQLWARIQAMADDSAEIGELASVLTAAATEPAGVHR